MGTRPTFAQGDDAASCVPAEGPGSGQALYEREQKRHKGECIGWCETSTLKLFANSEEAPSRMLSADGQVCEFNPMTQGAFANPHSLAVGYCRAAWEKALEKAREPKPKGCCVVQ